jgi:hypothetical protein
MKKVVHGLVALTLIAMAGNAAAKDADESPFDDTPWTSEGGHSLQIDNDLFSGAPRDQDYSWGGAYTFSSPHPGPLLAPLHAVRSRLDAWLAPDESQRHDWAPDLQATQIGILAMTPSTLRSPEPLYDDRPYASLIFVTSSQVRVLEAAIARDSPASPLECSGCTPPRSCTASCTGPSATNDRLDGTTRSPRAASRPRVTSQLGSGCSATPARGEPIFRRRSSRLQAARVSSRRGALRCLRVGEEFSRRGGASIRSWATTLPRPSRR